MKLAIYFLLKNQDFFIYCKDFVVVDDPDDETTYWWCYETTVKYLILICAIKNTN